MEPTANSTANVQADSLDAATSTSPAPSGQGRLRNAPATTSRFREIDDKLPAESKSDGFHGGD
jgi:hypothetical protein